MRTLLLVLLTSLPLPALAQSSLGISGGQLSLGLVEDEAGDHRGEMRALVDVAVTEYHGFQGDLAFSDTATGGIGTLSTHLYMTPKAGQKYRLFAALGDVDGRAFMYGSLGAEGMLSLGPDTSVEARAGVGWGMSTVSTTSSPAAPLRIG